MERLNGIYARLGRSNAIVTLAEGLLVLRDMDLRLKKLEGFIEGLEQTTDNRRGTGKLSKRKVSTS